MPISKKKAQRKADSKKFIKEQREKMLAKVGYADLKAKHGKSKRPDIPDYKVKENVPLSNRVSPNGMKVKSGAHHPDAIQFPVGNSHKQGLELIYSPEYASQMNGKKT